MLDDTNSNPMPDAQPIDSNELDLPEVQNKAYSCFQYGTDIPPSDIEMTTELFASGCEDTPIQNAQDPEQPTIRYQLCFSGFSKEKKAELKLWATEAGHKVRDSVTNNLTHLFCGLPYRNRGEHYGHAKLERAAEVGANVIDKFDDLTDDEWKEIFASEEFQCT